MKNLIVTVMLATASAVPVFSCAQSQTKNAIDERDAKYLSQLLTLNSYELMLTRMASLKALSVEMRSLSDKMNREHQKLDASLTAYANRFNVSLDADKREKYVSKIEKWDSDAVSAEWDRDITEELLDAHRELVATLQAAPGTVGDEALKTILTGSLPIMQQHLDELVLLKGRVRSGTSALAANPSVDRTDASSELPPGNEKDAKFLSDLRLMNTYELRLAEMILKKGNHRALKNAAQDITEAHRTLEEKLRRYASKKRYGNDADEASKLSEKLNKWQEKKGGMEWDADIVEELIDSHKDGIDMLEDAVSDVRDEELKTIMSQALPDVRSHLKMLEPLKEEVKKPWKGK